MIIESLDTLLKGKGTRIKNREYFPTEAYVGPFYERMSKITNEFIIQATTPNQISLTKDGEIDLEDTVFNRVYIQAVLPDYLSFDNHKQVIGLVYGLDVRKPIYKLYQGGINCACTNLCIFNPDFLEVRELEPETPMDFRPVQRLLEQTSDVASWLNHISNDLIPYDQQLISENLGNWTRRCLSKSYDNGFGKVKLATSTAIDAYKLLYTDEESPYYVKEGDQTSMFNVYNAFTDIISNDKGKDVMNKAEKCLLLKDILGLD